MQHGQKVIHDNFAVAIWKNSNIVDHVDHVPWEIPKVLLVLPQRSGSEKTYWQ